MQKEYNNKHLNDFDDEINLLKLFNVLFEGKLIIFSVTAFISILGVVYSLLLPNIYESKSLLVPVSNSSGISGALSSYNAGLAGLAGINLQTGIDETNTTKAINKISSLSFFENNILKNIYLPDLMAVKSWNPKTNEISYDEKIFNANSNTWVRKSSYSVRQIPSAQQSFKVFKTKNLRFSLDKKTGIITLSIKHQSPIIAKQWAELVISEINNFYRQKDKTEAEIAASYLNEQILKTGFSEIKQVIAQLLQEETKKLSLIEANEFYVFEYIDPPAIMEKKSEPSRSLICIAFFLLGSILSIVIVLSKYYFFNEKVLSDGYIKNYDEKEL